MRNKAIAIIPARGGSKGIPRKNLKYFNGKPLISYVISQCKLAQNIDHIYVSTDNDEIANLAIKFGAKVIERPKELSNDEIQLEPAIHHAVLKIEEQGIKSDIIGTLQLTSPLLSHKSIDKIVNLLIINPKIDSIISGFNDPHLGWQNLDGKIIPKYKERLCRQWLPDDFRETGGITCTRRKFVSSNNRLGNNIEIFELPKKESIDINDIYDWKIAESIVSIKSILFVVSCFDALQKAISISDFFGGYRINFVNVNPLDNNITQRIKENNFYFKSLEINLIKDYINHKKFDLVFLEKKFGEFINKKNVNYKSFFIEEFTYDLLFDNLSL